MASAQVQYRVGFSPPDGAYITLPQKPLCLTPTFCGPLEELEQYGFNIWNEAKRCTECDKTCASMLTSCNGCNASLSDELSRTPNCLLAFALGVEKEGLGPARSLRMSMRYHDPRAFVYDDICPRSPIHFNCVPSELIRDLKELLRRDDALDIISLLEDVGWKALEAMATPEWISMMGTPLHRLRELLICGFNAAPSQFQLHLHIKAPPLLPEDHFLTVTGIRFLRRRWLPLEYVKACAAVRPKPIIGPDDDICEVFDRLGHFQYKQMMDDAVMRYARASEEVACWKPEWFTHAVIEGRVVDKDGNVCAGAPDEWARRDRTQMQNCGRPFVDGRPTPINYYGFAPKVR